MCVFHVNIKIINKHFIYQIFRLEISKIFILSNFPSPSLIDDRVDSTGFYKNKKIKIKNKKKTKHSCTNLNPCMITCIIEIFFLYHLLTRKTSVLPDFFLCLPLVMQDIEINFGKY